MQKDQFAVRSRSHLIGQRRIQIDHHAGRRRSLAVHADAYAFHSAAAHGNLVLRAGNHRLRQFHHHAVGRFQFAHPRRHRLAGADLDLQPSAPGTTFTFRSWLLDEPSEDAAGFAATRRLRPRYRRGFHRGCRSARCPVSPALLFACFAAAILRCCARCRWRRCSAPPPAWPQEPPTIIAVARMPVVSFIAVFIGGSLLRRRRSGFSLRRLPRKVSNRD
jgi:hypothetical protein